MGLEEIQKKLKDQIKEAEAREEKAFGEQANDAGAETDADKEARAAAEKKEQEDKAAAELAAKDAAPKEDVETTEKTNADHARERREKKTREDKLREELSAANARILELSKLPERAPAEDKPEPAPIKADDPVAYAEWEAKQAKVLAKETKSDMEKLSKRLDVKEQQQQQERLYQAAQEELISYEGTVRQKHPDYEDAKKYYANMLAFSIKSLNPKISDANLVKAVNNQIMLRASQLVNDGYENPVQAIYDEVKSMGYQAKKPEENKEEKKPDLDRVAANRARNAGMAAAAGSSGRGELTKSAAADLTVAEWAALPQAEKQRLLRQA